MRRPLDPVAISLRGLKDVDSGPRASFSEEKERGEWNFDAGHAQQKGPGNLVSPWRAELPLAGGGISACPLPCHSLCVDFGRWKFGPGEKHGNFPRLSSDLKRCIPAIICRASLDGSLRTSATHQPLRRTRCDGVINRHTATLQAPRTWTAGFQYCPVLLELLFLGR